jgi:SAM-dependent methyltransferase
MNRLQSVPAPEMLTGSSTDHSSTDGIVSEADRIRAVYAKRRTRPVYSMFEPAQLLAVQERERKLLRLLASCGLASVLEKARILEVGCGTGSWLREFVRWGARPENIFGIDLVPERIAAARCLCPSAVTLKCQDATDLRDITCRFDIVLQSTVFTSILDPQMKRQIAREMLRVLNPEGMIVWYDFRVNNPINPDVRGIKKKEIEELFSGCNLRLEKLTLAPPLGRPIARMSRTLYRVASTIKPLCTHYLGIIRKL